MELIQFVGERIRELRNKHGGGVGLSQEDLANELDLAANTVSRWETGTYRPSIEDLEALSRFFNVSILEFFPKDVKEQNKENIVVKALLRAAQDLPDDDILELQRYAEFRRARVEFKKKQVRKKPGRPKKESD